MSRAGSTRRQNVPRDASYTVMSNYRNFIKNLSAVFFIVFVIGVAGSFAQTSFQIVPGVKAGAITARTSEADLRRIYGSRNVLSEPVGIGEGETVPGAVIYPNDPQRRLEIVWKSGKEKKMVDYVQFSGRKSLWKISNGVTLGTRLKTLEKINGRGFSLYGFGWDYAGTVVSWKGGKLSRSFGNGGKLVTLLLSPENVISKTLEKDYEAMLGDGEFSSKHKSMQRLNPEVYMAIVKLR